MTIKNNKKIKVVVLCIVVATTFWFFNAMNYSYATNVSFPLKYSIQSKQLILTSSVPKRIGINVYGTGWDILKASLGLGYEPYFFNLPSEQDVDFKSSTLMPYISKELAKLKVNFIHEQNWKIRTDSILTKKINLEGYINTTDQNRVSLYQPNIQPAYITITGPRLYLDSLDTEMVLTVKEAIKKGPQKLDIKIKDWINPELKSSIKTVNMKFSIDQLVETSNYLYNQDSTSRQIVNYTKPESYTNLNSEQLSSHSTGNPLPSLYSITSIELDSTYQSNNE
jgi:hypothetical protein